MADMFPALLPAVPAGTLDAYLNRINSIAMLTFEEEQALAHRYHDHQDLQAAQHLVLCHLRYVARIAKGYMGYGLALGDLIQEGSIGLMKAVKRFDPSVGVRLVSFAVHWIKAEIHEFVLRNWRIVKIATTKAQRKLFFNLRQAKQRLGWSTAEEVQAIAKDLGVRPEDVTQMEERLNARDLGFDLPEGSDDSPAFALPSPVEYLTDAEVDPALQLEAQDWERASHAGFYTALASLDARSRDILQKRWLQENDRYTLEKLADIYKISIERVRQIEKNAIAKLKEYIEKAA